MHPHVENTHKTDTKKGMSVRSHVKVTLITSTFSDMKEIVHYEFIPQGQTINSALCKEDLREDIQQKRLEKWRNGWILHLNNK
jgi:hypothetical protein